ncbi:MAG: FAD-binding oxidoreductase [Vulcanimicrobiota bacterium]
MISSAGLLILGAGVVGCSLAYHLNRLGEKDVFVLDRGAICSGETSRSGGFVQTHWSSPHEVKLIAWSRDFFQAHAEPCGYVKGGYLHVTGPEREQAVREVHQMLLGLGLESNWLSPRELKKLQPLLRVDDLVGGAYEETSGWADPVATTRFLASSARVLEGVGARQISVRDGRVVGVETQHGFISCPRVVLCAGPWSPGLHPCPERPLPLLNKRGQVGYFSRPGGLPRRELGFYDEVTGLYSHPDGPELLVGLDWHFEPLFEPDRYDREPDRDYIAGAQGALSHRFPSLAGAGWRRGLVGIYDFTPDGHPVVDQMLEGLWVAAGFSGAGFKSAPALGLGLAEWITSGAPRTVDLGFLSLERFAS